MGNYCFPLTDHHYNLHSILALLVTISAKSLKHSSSASYVNINWSHPFEHVHQPDLLGDEALCLRSDEQDTVAVEFSEVLNDPVSYWSEVRSLCFVWHDREFIICISLEVKRYPFCIWCLVLITLVYKSNPPPKPWWPILWPPSTSWSLKN